MNADGMRKKSATLPSPLRVPLMPAVIATAGLCTRHPRPELWTSGLRAEREAAAAVCAWCPALDACRAWSIGLPLADNAVYAGMGARERRQARRAASAAA